MPFFSYPLRTLVFLSIISLFNTSCDSRHSDLKRGVSYAKNQFEKVNSSPMSAIAFQSAMETGGSLVSFIVSSLPPDSRMPRFINEGPATPWSIVLSEPGDDGEIMIEGFGEDSTKPLFTEKVTITKKFDD